MRYIGLILLVVAVLGVILGVAGVEIPGLTWLGDLTEKLPHVEEGK